MRWRCRSVYPPAPLLRAAVFRRYIEKNVQTSKPSRGLSGNLRVMKLCLKWHNLSLLYIWSAAQEAIIKKMKIGYSTWGMPTVPIDTALSHLASLGYDGVELTIIPRFTTELSTLDAAERKRIASLFQQHNLALPAIAAHSSLLEIDPEAHAKNMWRLKGGVDLAVELAQGDEPPAVNTTPGGKPEEWEIKKEFLVERVGELVDYGASRGVIIAMEPHVGAIMSIRLRRCLNSSKWSIRRISKLTLTSAISILSVCRRKRQCQR